MTKQPDNAPVNILEQINQVCRDFGKQFSLGKSPRIEKYVLQVTEEAQETLFGNLIGIEVNYRQRKGESPTSDEYIQRFPQFAKQVRRAFFEPSMNSSQTEDEANATANRTDPACDADLDPTFEIPSLNCLGDYELIGELGRGGMGIVHEARHTKTGNRVALKTLPTSLDGTSIDANKLHRFRKEFRSLSEVNHPNLVGMQTLEVDGNRWFFTMDLIEGEDFISYVRPGGQLDEERLRACLPQMAKGIMALHDRGIVHRDLKPGNILVSREGRVVILDFGLVAQLQKAADVTQTRSGMFVGTAPYAAPEQIGGHKTEANDWYAFGTMLYEALTGQVPFRDSNPFNVLTRKQQEAPPTLSGTDDVPSDLAELADGLIVRNPESRLNAESVTECLQIDDETRTRGTTQGSKGSHGSVDDEEVDLDAFEQEEIVLIGREKQSAELRVAKETLLKTRTPSVVWITGLSGEGKSSLVEKFLQPTRRGDQMLVLSGRCYDRESVPYKVIDCWMDSLVSFLRSRPESYLQRVLPDDVVGLAELFPVLRRVQLIESMPSINSALMTSETLRHRSFGALRDLLVNISEQFPVVLFIDDLQWGDAESVVAFERMMQTPGAPSLLLLGSFRSDERGQSSFLKQWDVRKLDINTRVVTLDPLDTSQSLELVNRLIPDAENVSEEELRRICDQSEGNPYLLQQMLEGFDAESKGFLALPLAGVIEARLGRLPQEARPLLEMLAVAGQAVTASDVGPLAGFGTTPYATLTRMRNEKLVRLLGSGEHQQVDTFHDQIRTSMLGKLTEADDKEWHRRIAEVLESFEGKVGITCDQFPPFDEFGKETKPLQFGRLFDLAYHFHGAQASRALDYLILAGEQALRIYSNQDALYFLSRAHEMIDDQTPDASRFRVLYGMGMAKIRSRRVVEAINLLQSSKQWTSNRSERMQMNRALGVAYGNLGQTANAIECLDRALAELGRPRPQSMVGTFFRVIRDAVQVVTAPQWNVGRSLQERKKAVTELRILERLKFEVVQKDSLSTADCGLHSTVASYQSGDPTLILFGHSSGALMFCFFGLPRISRICQRRYLGFEADQALPPELHASALWNESMIAYLNGDFERLYNASSDQLEAATRCGDNMSAVFGEHLVRHADAWTQATGKESTTAQREHKLVLEIGDQKGLCWALYGRAEPLARAGLLSEAAAMMQQAFRALTSEQWYGTEPVCRGVHGFLLMQASKYDLAANTLSAAWEMTRTHWMFYSFNVLSLPLYLESLLGHTWQDRQAEIDRKLPKRLARWIHVLYRSAPVLQPSMLRSLGRHAAWEGKKSKAIRYFERGRELTTERGMPYHRARILLDLAAVKEGGRKENLCEAIRLLKEMESVIPRDEALQLGDQFDETVVAPQFDLEAWEREHGSMLARRFPSKSSD